MNREIILVIIRDLEDFSFSFFFLIREGGFFDPDFDPFVRLVIFDI